jgi:hypothetical protein
VSRAANEVDAPLADVALLAGAFALLRAARDAPAAGRRAGQLLEALGCRGATREVDEWIAAREARLPR